eukprot:4070421-Amphidinium_carterae.3
MPVILGHSSDGSHNSTSRPGTDNVLIGRLTATTPYAKTLPGCHLRVGLCRTSPHPCFTKANNFTSILSAVVPFEWCRAVATARFEPVARPGCVTHQPIMHKMPGPQVCVIGFAKC